MNRLQIMIPLAAIITSIAAQASAGGGGGPGSIERKKILARNVAHTKYEIELYRAKLPICEEALAGGEPLPYDFAVYSYPDKPLEIDPALLTLPDEEIEKLWFEGNEKALEAKEPLAKCFEEYAQTRHRK